LVDVFEDEDHWCLVMELMQGGDLFDLISTQGSFPEYDVREAARILIDTVRYCHL
jgi:serine/threonine protein kinase